MRNWGDEDEDMRDHPTGATAGILVLVIVIAVVLGLVWRLSP